MITYDYSKINYYKITGYLIKISQLRNIIARFITLQTPKQRHNLAQKEKKGETNWYNDSNLNDTKCFGTT